MKNFIIRQSKELDIAEIKFAKPKILSKQKEQLQQWLENNYHGNKEFLQRNIDIRTNPSLMFDNLKTIIVVADTYPSNVIFNQKSNLKIIAAKYATQPDYHITLKQKLIQLCNAILTKKNNTNYKCFVDSGIVMEKQWAVEAGLGWQGKNSLIINKKLGSFFHIGVIFLDIEIETDKPIQNHCGNCNLCYEKCPTNAIARPGVVDCNRCISFNTIERPNKILPNVDAEIKNTGYVFGCDICQNICPWNKKQLQNKPIYFDFDENILNWTENDYMENFKGTTLLRPGYENFMNNVKNVCR